jgi:hypothetical protein
MNTVATMTWTHVCVIIGCLVFLQAMSSTLMYVMLRRFLSKEIAMQIADEDRHSKLAMEIKSLNQKIGLVYDVAAMLNEVKLGMDAITRALRDFKRM